MVLFQQFFSNGVRMIWYCRNLIVHDKEGMSPIIDARITRHRTASYLKPDFKFHIYEEEGSMIWQKPEGDTIKLNCDGSWFQNNTVAGFGCIAIKSDGVILGCRSSFMDGVTSSLQAEGISFLLAFQWAVAEGWNSCIFETCRSIQLYV